MTGVQLNPTSLKRVGVSVTGYVSTGHYRLTCDTCGAKWTPDMLGGGHLPRGWWKCPVNSAHTHDSTPEPTPDTITPRQLTVLKALFIVATRQGAPIHLKLRYQSAAASLKRRGLVEAVEVRPDLRSYRLTAAGLAYMQGLANDAQ